MLIRNFSEAFTALQQFVPPPFSSQQVYSLDRIRDFMTYLGNPQDKTKVIHVAGTSGKTSTAYYSAALLSASGFKTGLTVSPHIMELNERVQIDGVPLAEDVFCTDLGEFLAMATASGILLTYFELLVAFAYWEFAHYKVDYAIVEVGLGGLMDGTNTITRADKTCVITDIGYDHVAVLGNTLTEIATQKAGIIQPDNTIYMYEQSAEVMAAVKQRITAQHATLRLVSAPTEKLDLLTPFQRRNFHLAVQAVTGTINTDLNDDVKAQAMRTLVPGRFETFQYDQSTIILDGAHNQQKIAAFAESLGERYPDQPVTAVVALVAGSGERQSHVTSAIGAFAEEVILTSFSADQDTHKTSVPLPDLRDAFAEASFTGHVATAESPLAGVQQAIADKRPLIVLVGSFYSLAAVRAWLIDEGTAV